MMDGILSPVNYTAAKELLDAVELRHQALSSNLANVQTPGYKRVDLDPRFRTSFANQLERADQEGLQRLTAEIRPDETAVSQRLDGNNVVMEQELLELNRNSLEYQFLTEYLSSSLKHLRTAITGRHS